MPLFTDQWVVLRDGVTGPAAVYVDTQNVAEQRGHVLTVTHRRMPERHVVGGPTVTERDIEVAVVRAEGERAAVMVKLRLIDL